MSDQRLKIAVIGAGVAGIAAAHVLQRKHDVTLFERNDYIGGHTNTVVLESGPDAGTPIDTGFIVLNDRTYPTFNRLLTDLGVSIRDSEMSFSYYCEQSGLYYSGSTLNGLFAQRRNLVRPGFLRMIRDILRFYRRATADIQTGDVAGLTLGEYLERGRFGPEFREDHLLPMAAAIWSTRPARMLDFPADYIVRFFKNHGLLSVWDRPQWQTVVGGSRQYVKAFLSGFKGQVHACSPVRSVHREEGGVRVCPEGDSEGRRFDRVVLAAHADESLAMLADASDEEREALGVWSYENNHVILHRDPALMPPRRRAWSSWNYVRERGAEGQDRPVSLNYWMNRLQGLETTQPYFVSVNRSRSVPDDMTVMEIDYTHPVYTFEALKSQQTLRKINGRRNTFFCGAYFGYGFHEDGAKSGVEVARAFGLDL